MAASRCPQRGCLSRIDVEVRGNLFDLADPAGWAGLGAKKWMEEVYMILGWFPAQGSRRTLATWAALAYKMRLVAHVGKLCHELLSCLTLSRRSTRARAQAGEDNLCPTRRPKGPADQASFPNQPRSAKSISVTYFHLSVGQTQFAHAAKPLAD